jgi:hypothetical protein
MANLVWKKTSGMFFAVKWRYVNTNTGQILAEVFRDVSMDAWYGVWPDKFETVDQAKANVEKIFDKDGKR